MLPALRYPLSVDCSVVKNKQTKKSMRTGEVGNREALV